MGFGLVSLGFLTVLGMMPNLFVYYSFTIIFPVAGGLIMLGGFVRLRHYGAHFGLLRFFALAYTVISLIMMPFLILSGGKYITDGFLIISKVTRIIFLFGYFFFILNGIKNLAEEIGNEFLSKKARRNLRILYFYISFCILTMFLSIEGYLIAAGAVFDMVYFGLMLSNIYGCHMRIGYEGQDTAETKGISRKR